ncbi:DNA methyltransferase [Nodularia sp. UHCC 0506]|uniref:DNA methyltransferase n=1 Tax=Nodularia sp. UHCC 0506 TaxID=3110243 RepID=UPI002B21F97F|nr:DNA methyltransferase [Nodularia sp. UHCC 0506]MEA5513500.1 DNA methyltransferase [Nodularia sp. UHCC 0506]
MQEKSVSSVAHKLLSSFKEWTHTEWQPSAELFQELEKFLSLVYHENIQTKNVIKNNLIFIINERLELNKHIYRLFIDNSASKGIIFNYHEKIKIEDAINHPIVDFPSWFATKLSIYSKLDTLLDQIEEKRNKSLIDLDKYLQEDKKSHLVIESIFCSYIYFSLLEKDVHQALNKNCQLKYFNHYWDHLKYFHESQVSRENRLIILDLDNLIDPNLEYKNILNIIIYLIREIYSQLTNHCYFAIIIGDKFSCKWSLIADIAIFSEKFIEQPIDRTYFRWKEIEKQTEEYIKNLDKKQCKFYNANEGFTYKDCYLVYENNYEKCVLLFEKNERDETPIPCPKCRTFNIQGNSYPIIGVRSWECTNIFCGEKSKYNRGKRYSLSAIIRQQAILDDNNIIEKDILKAWRRDVVEISSSQEILDFLIKCYSLYNDTVVIYTSQEIIKQERFGRNIKYKKYIEYESIDNTGYDKYRQMSFFKRFLVNRSKEEKKILCNLSSLPNLALYNNGAFEILCNLESESIGGAVTSPPYYNARDYSQWTNIYCYLYDMYNIAKEVFRCLKKGSPYLFNIFDYFDNERIIVFSDMGKKRVILSSYISFIFRHIGFQHIGNIAWDKGEIEGNRNFNHGNHSPYYQAPLNCWEHILVFSKGEPSFEISNIPKIIKEKPVMKMVRGKNVHGHTAPFPEAIPNLLFSLISPEETVLDPFAGSMTTGRCAVKMSRKSINIELHKKYCDLALNLLNKQTLDGIQLNLM